MPRRPFIAGCVLLFCFTFTTLSVLAEPPGNAGFWRGVNLSHWFAQIQVGGDRLEHLRTHFTEKDFELIGSLGLDHVRFTVDPDVLESQVFDGWAEYRRAVDMILSKGLNVIIDVHPSGEFKHALAADAEKRDAFIVFWTGLAERYADTDPECVRFEMLNEPEMSAELWEPLQARLAAVVRRVAPDHTIILCGAKWSGTDQLVGLQPIDDPNVVYNFHFYEPHQFTHQAATWGAPHWRDMKGLPYPASEEGVRQALAGTTNPAAVNDITRYGQSGWGPDKVREEIGRAAEWARAHGGLTLTCNEFGVYMKAAAPEHRATWIRDVRETLEAQQIGWTMWDYAGGFGIVRDGKPIESVAEALGLH